MGDRTAERSRGPGGRIAVAEPTCDESLSRRQNETISDVVARLDFLREVFTGYVGAVQAIVNRIGFDPWRKKPNLFQLALLFLDDYDRTVMIDKMQRWLEYAEQMVPTLSGAKSRYLGRFKKWYFPSGQEAVDPDDSGVENLGEFIVKWVNDRRAERD